VSLRIARAEHPEVLKIIFLKSKFLIVLLIALACVVLLNTTHARHSHAENLHIALACVVLLNTTHARHAQAEK
jgi:hypothetical protein